MHTEIVYPYADIQPVSPTDLCLAAIRVIPPKEKQNKEERKLLLTNNPRFIPSYDKENKLGEDVMASALTPTLHDRPLPVSMLTDAFVYAKTHPSVAPQGDIAMVTHQLEKWQVDKALREEVSAYGEGNEAEYSVVAGYYGEPLLFLLQWATDFDLNQVIVLREGSLKPITAHISPTEQGSSAIDVPNQPSYHTLRRQVMLPLGAS